MIHQLFKSEVYLKLENHRISKHQRDVLKRRKERTEEVRVVAYCDTPAEVDQILLRVNLDSYSLYINEEKITFLRRLGLKDHHQLPVLFELVLLSDKIAETTNRKVSDILSTISDFFHIKHNIYQDADQHFSLPQYETLVNKFYIHEHSKSQYSINYTKQEGLLFQINFTSGGKWYKPEYKTEQPIGVLQDFLRDLSIQDGEIKSIKILDKEFILPESVGFNCLHDLIQNGLMRHLLSTKIFSKGLLFLLINPPSI